MSASQTARPAIAFPEPKAAAPAGYNGSLNGQSRSATQYRSTVEGQDSPQAKHSSASIDLAPAGNGTARPATDVATPNVGSLAGHQAGRGHHGSDTQCSCAPAAGIPGAQRSPATHRKGGTGDLAPPATIPDSTSTLDTPLADPLLALAADVLSDLEKVRIANENRLRQLTRSEDAVDKDGETGRGFGLDLAHPGVARITAIVQAMKCDSKVVHSLTGEKTSKRKGCCLEHDAERNLTAHLRQHPLGAWMAAQGGVGPKQGARLLAAIGDPYIRPEIIREDCTIEPSRPRLVSELWALCGYHVISGAAPKRMRGQKANWSSAAKMRAYLVAESCMKQSGTPYRAVYDTARAKYAEAVHDTECVRCGPKGKPAPPGSPLSNSHKHARALRAVAKEVLRDLWREAKRLHEQAPVSGHMSADTQHCSVTDGPNIPASHTPNGSQGATAGGEQDDGRDTAA